MRPLRRKATALLLRPTRTTDAGYRIYGAEQVDTLQQILFFRQMGLPLDTIGRVLSDPAFDRSDALRGHLAALRAEEAALEKAEMLKTIGQLTLERDFLMKQAHEKNKGVLLRRR